MHLAIFSACPNLGCVILSPTYADLNYQFVPLNQEEFILKLCERKGPGFALLTPTNHFTIVTVWKCVVIIKNHQKLQLAAQNFEKKTSMTVNVSAKGDKEAYNSNTLQLQQCCWLRQIKSWVCSFGELHIMSSENIT